MVRPTLSLRARALSYLAAREHSRLEMARKLARHDEDSAAIDSLLDTLEVQGLLSTERFVASVLHRRAPRLGAARLRQELRAKGVPDEAMRDSLQGLADSEEARAREVWQRRFGSPAGDSREMARQARFLMARGFSGEIVRRILRQAGSYTTEDHTGDCSGGQMDDQTHDESGSRRGDD
ncbi:MAG: recombination regulator RecX [Burkholderiales bacterium]|nr:recombination regulator RecX [Burkholderiales bacterium]